MSSGHVRYKFSRTSDGIARTASGIVAHAGLPVRSNKRRRVRAVSDSDTDAIIFVLRYSSSSPSRRLNAAGSPVSTFDTTQSDSRRVRSHTQSGNAAIELCAIFSVRSPVNAESDGRAVSEL